MKSLRYAVLALIALSLVAGLTGCSKTSNPVAPTAVTPVDETAPAAPTNLVAALDVETGLQTLQWTASTSPNVAGYRIYVYSPDPERESAYLQIALTNSTRYAVIGMPSGSYYYRLRSTSGTGVNSGWSESVQVQIGMPLGGDPEPGDGIIQRKRP